jgi:hypothetical protein
MLNLYSKISLKLLTGKTIDDIIRESPQEIAVLTTVKQDLEN